MKTKLSIPIIVIGVVTLAVFFFYLYYVNLSTDTIILFLAQKIFLGQWLVKGIIPFFNPHIFAGVPFLFDPGMGHLHPFNIFFLFPYPLSFAGWVGASVFLFLTGFYLFFRRLGSGKTQALFFSLLLFLSGSGFIRLNNPTIFAVISHYGLFLYSLSFLKEKKNNILFPLLVGILMTLAGHLQFVMYGYLLGILTAYMFYKVPVRKLLIYYSILAVSVLGYFIMALPLVLESTRIGAGQDYMSIGPIAPLQFFQLLLPFFLGYIHNGSAWNAGPTAVILFSLSGTFMFVGYILKNKIGRGGVFIFLLLLLLSFGLIQLPFFRGAGQIWVVIHVLALGYLATNRDSLIHLFNKKAIRMYLISAIFCFAFFVFLISPVFPTLFLRAYSIAKHGAQSLFFDFATVRAIGWLVGLSLLPVGGLLLTLYFGVKAKKYMIGLLFIYLIIEGGLINYFHGYFIPTNVIKNNLMSIGSKDTLQYRVQSTEDVIPYTGFHTYMGSLLFRPPFSKEVPIIDQQEENTFEKLRAVFAAAPSSWIMTVGMSGVQGYNTFVPKSIAGLFTPVSPDYKAEYAYIISRNAEFVDTSKISHINAIDTSRVTMHDPRWESLAVKYFISDRPLQKYNLIAKRNGKYVYENPSSPSIYSLVDKKGKSNPATPVYFDPNGQMFHIQPQDVGKQLVILVNPEGFEAELNGTKQNVLRQRFKLIIPLDREGTLRVYYSPLFHLLQTLKSTK